MNKHKNDDCDFGKSGTAVVLEDWIRDSRGDKDNGGGQRGGNSRKLKEKGREEEEVDVVPYTTSLAIYVKNAVVGFLEAAVSQDVAIINRICAVLFKQEGISSWSNKGVREAGQKKGPETRRSSQP
jgi:hypothetical protein